jgi:hypothetical protein
LENLTMTTLKAILTNAAALLTGIALASAGQSLESPLLGGAGAGLLFGSLVVGLCIIIHVAMTPAEEM